MSLATSGTSNKSITELEAEVRNLQEAIAAKRKEEAADAIAKAQSIIAEFQLTPADLFPNSKAKTATSKKDAPKLAPKYRDPDSGKTWTGRGLEPKWINGQREKFLIATN